MVTMYDLIMKINNANGLSVSDQKELELDSPPKFSLTQNRTLKSKHYSVQDKEETEDDELAVISISFTIESDLIKGYGSMSTTQPSVYLIEPEQEIEHVEWVVEEHPDKTTYRPSVEFTDP